MATVNMDSVDKSRDGKKNRAKSIIHHSVFGSPLWIYLVLFVAPCLFLAVLAIQPFVALDLLVRDPLAAAHAPAYYGFVSNVGVVVWCATAAVCLFAAVVRWHAGAEERREAWFLAYGGSLTTVLMLDDFFMLHETVFPFHLFIPEIFVFGAYGLGMLVYLVLFYRTILSLEPVLLGLCLGFLGLSMVGDMLWEQPDGVWSSLIEDGSKFLGICLWCAFHLRASWHLVTAAHPASTAGRDRVAKDGPPETDRVVR